MSSSPSSPAQQPHEDPNGGAALRPIICPSLLSCDLARLADDAQQMLDLGADWLHMVCNVLVASSTSYLRTVSRST